MLKRLLLCLLLWLPAGPLSAAEPAPGVAEATAAAGPAELERLVKTLEDDAQRTALIGDLKALIAAQKRVEAAPSAGARLLEVLSGKIESAGAQLGHAAEAVLNLPRLATWLQDGLASPERRAAWLIVVAKLSLILAAGLIAQHLVQWLLRRPYASIEAQRTASPATRLLLAFLLLSVLLILFLVLRPTGILKAKG